MVRSSKMKDDKGTIKSAGKENEPELENGKKKTKEERPATKIVVRRLPPTMTAEQFKLQVSPLPEIDYFYFVPADISLMPNAFSRAYINFVDQSDLFIFTQKFDGYVFIDSKGGEFPAVVEFAPFQRIPKNRPNRKKDPKVGTIESDPIYIQFKEYLEALSLENKTTANASKQHFFETTMEPERKEANNTPLLDFIKNKRAERQRIREEKREEKRKRDLERKRVKEEQRRIRKEDDTSVLKVLNNQNASSRERVREKDTKPSFAKKKFDDFKLAPKEKTAELRTKDSKIRTGKSYLEERQRQAERREEQRKKLSQNSSSATDTKLSTEDKTLENEEGMLEEKPSESGSKVKDSDFKRADRSYKRDEGRGSSFKYESKREREGEERRPRRANDRSYQSTKRDDERSEDTGRKRYSETRKNYDSPRERYKDKDKNKVSNLKKTPESTVEIDSTIEKLNKQPDTDILVNNEDNVECKDSADVLSEGKKTKQIELKDKVNPTRRKSFDYDKNRQSSYSSSKTNNKEKFSEKKRRNSFGSSKNKESLDVKTHHMRNTSDTEIKESFHDTSTEQSLKEESKLEKEIPHNEEEHTEEDGLKKDFEIKDRSIPKRRNSTGERQSLEKLSSRRNSLGSEDKNMICTFDNEEHTCDSDISAKGKNKDDKNQQRNSRDPRTERRIRNKDRPSLEIYRPGMGKFSKQRLEREKGLGSSTEIESPSSSPSPTPIMKHKILSGSQH